MIDDILQNFYEIWDDGEIWFDMSNSKSQMKYCSLWDQIIGKGTSGIPFHEEVPHVFLLNSIDKGCLQR